MENISGTIDKAVDLLEIFIKQDSDIGLSELAELSGYNTTTVHRLLSTMVKRGLIRQGKKNGKYALGIKNLEFCFRIRGNLHHLDTVYLFMSKLCREQNVPVNLTVLDTVDQIVVDELGIVSDFRFTAPIGKRLPLYATAPGKVFLAYMSTGERQEYYNRVPLEPITPKTIIDIECLNAELEAVKRDGVAFDEEQYIPGAWAVSTPILKGKGDIAYVATIVLPISQVDALRSRECATALKRCTTELSATLSRSS